VSKQKQKKGPSKKDPKAKEVQGMPAKRKPSSKGKR